MANWDNLKAAIQDVIKENGNEEITGFCPVMVNKTDGSVNFMDFFESYKLIDFPRVMA